MTHHEPFRLFNLRMFSCRPSQGWVVFPQNFLAQAFFTATDAAAGGALAATVRYVNRIQIARTAKGRARTRTLQRHARRTACVRALPTEFISVRLRRRRAPMNRSLGCEGFHGPVGLLDSGSSILNLSEGVFHGNDC